MFITIVYVCVLRWASKLVDFGPDGSRCVGHLKIWNRPTADAKHIRYDHAGGGEGGRGGRGRDGDRAGGGEGGLLRERGALLKEEMG